MKCQAAIDRRIPIFYTDEPKDMYFITLFKKEISSQVLSIKLPTFPKNIEEMLNVYYWLEQLFYNAFGKINIFDQLNPELIKLFFGNETIKTHLQFYCDGLEITLTNYNIKSALDFVQNYVFTDSVALEFSNVENVEQYNDLLLRILLNKGEEFKTFRFWNFKNLSLFNLLINHIETSKNFSNKLPAISFHLQFLHSLTISERAENVEICEYENSNSVTYQ